MPHITLRSTCNPPELGLCLLILLFLASLIPSNFTFETVSLGGTFALLCAYSKREDSKECPLSVMLATINSSVLQNQVVQLGEGHRTTN